jgi:group I intron endonuclease
MKKNKVSCIYKITCLNNNKFYIGSTIDINKRLMNHVSFLKHNKHPNKYLQNCWNKYGEKNFKFEIIETINDTNQLLLKEKCWLDNTNCCNGKIGFNIATNPFALMAGRKHSLKTRQIMSLTRKSEKFLQNMTKQNIIKNILTNLRVLVKENKSLYEISKTIKISDPTLRKWLKILDPNLYLLFQINGKNKKSMNGFKTGHYYFKHGTK